MNERMSRAQLAQTQTDAVVDQGLKAYMQRVFLQMGGAVALSGVIAYLLASWGQSNPQAFFGLFSGTLGWVVMLAPLGIVLVASFGFNRLSYPALQACFWGYASLIGVSFSLIAFKALGDSVFLNAVGNAFFAAAAAFLGAALYGYVTNQDLTRFGSLLMMAVIGLLVAMIVNMFLGWETLNFIISGIGVLLFTALTAYDTQRLKLTYLELGESEVSRKLAVMGALGLYINFVLIFQFLLSFFSSE
jgi:FtsH-binding integral membrane protein